MAKTSSAHHQHIAITSLEHTRNITKLRSSIANTSILNICTEHIPGRCFKEQCDIDQFASACVRDNAPPHRRHRRTGAVPNLFWWRQRFTKAIRWRQSFSVKRFAGSSHIKTSQAM